MGLFHYFFRQPGPVRDFRVGYALLGLHFLVPALGYALDPAAAIAQFGRLGELLGAGPYPWAAGETGFVWRILAAGNVLTLGFLCFLLLSDLPRFYPALPPLVFLKSTAVVGYLGVFLKTRYPAFLAVSLWDAFNCFLFVFLARRALPHLR